MPLDSSDRGSSNLTEPKEPPFIFADGQRGIEQAELLLSQGKVLLVALTRGRSRFLEALERVFCSNSPDPAKGHLALVDGELYFRPQNSEKLPTKVGRKDVYKPLEVV